MKTTEISDKITRIDKPADFKSFEDWKSFGQGFLFLSVCIMIFLYLIGSVGYKETTYTPYEQAVINGVFHPVVEQFEIIKEDVTWEYRKEDGKTIPVVNFSVKFFKPEDRQGCKFIGLRASTLFKEIPIKDFIYTGKGLELTRPWGWNFASNWKLYGIESTEGVRFISNHKCNGENSWITPTILKDY